MSKNACSPLSPTGCICGLSFVILSIMDRYSLDNGSMERNGIVGNAVARTDRSALIKATRASDFPHQNIALQVLSGAPRIPIYSPTLLASFVGDPEDSDFPREFVTNSTAKLRQKNGKSK